jgi:hypothetical protein
MQGRAFLDIARELSRGTTEAHWRAATGRAYYALLLEGWAALEHWGFKAGKQQIHAFVRLKFTYAGDVDLKRIGVIVDDLVRLRNEADYQLQSRRSFRDVKATLQAIKDAAAGIALLDQIAADPNRRTAAINSITP